MNSRTRRLTLVLAALGVAFVGWTTRQENSPESATQPLPKPSPFSAQTARNAAATAEPGSTLAPAAAASSSGWADTTGSSQGASVVGEWTKPTNGSLAAHVRGEIRAPFPGTTALELGPARNGVFLAERTEILGEDEGVMIGSMEGSPGSLAVLSYAGGALSGTVNYHGEQRSYLINQTEDGTLRVTELDLTNAPDCGGCLDGHTNESGTPHVCTGDCNHS